MDGGLPSDMATRAFRIIASSACRPHVSWLSSPAGLGCPPLPPAQPPIFFRISIYRVSRARTLLSLPRMTDGFSTPPHDNGPPMGESAESFIIELLSGRRRGAMASALRGLLRIAESPYAALMRLRNKLYDLGTLRSHRVAPAVISVGNITAGGTGKTPTVVWLASSLRAAGFRPAVLLRGYGSSPGAPSDEATLLDEQLNPAEGGG